jgi:antirestriction protein ArdC
MAAVKTKKKTKKKSFNDNKAQDILKDMMKKILEQMESSEEAVWHRPWAIVPGIRPQNGSTGCEYRGINPFWLWVEKENNHWTSDFWFTKKQLKAMPEANIKGCERVEYEKTVKKGPDEGKKVKTCWFKPLDEDQVPQATPIVFFKRLNPLMVEDEATGEKKIVRRRAMVKVYWVYNMDQCENVRLCKKTQARIEAGKLKDSKGFTPIDACEDIVNNMQNPPSLLHGGNRCCYSPKADTVMMAPKENFEDEAAYYATLFHEEAHATGHSSRLDRGLEDTLVAFGDEDYSFEELVAEFTSAFLCGFTGIDSTKRLNNTAAYLKNWLKKLKANEDWLSKAATKAQAAFDHIVGVTYGTDEEEN